MSSSQLEARFSQMPWWLLLIEGIIAIIVGISMLVAPGMTTSIIVRILGIYWLVGGIIAIVGIFINHEQWGLKILIGSWAFRPESWLSNTLFGARCSFQLRRSY